MKEDNDEWQVLLRYLSLTMVINRRTDRRKLSTGMFIELWCRVRLSNSSFISPGARGGSVPHRGQSSSPEAGHSLVTLLTTAKVAI